MNLALRNIKYLISNKPSLGALFFRYNIAPPMPLFLLVHITSYCNKKCYFCYQKNETFRSDPDVYMKSSNFEQLLLSFKYIKPHVHLYGGEPLCHPEFSYFLKYSERHGYKPTLTTNGDYLDKYADDLMNSTLAQLNISVNGLIDSKGKINSDLNDKIGKFVKINKGKKMVNLNYVLEPSSYNLVDQIILHFNDNYKQGDFACFVIQHLMKSPKGNGEKMFFDSKKIVELLLKVKKLSLKFPLLFLPNIKLQDIDNYYNNEHHFKNKCSVPWLGLNIYPNLTVTPGVGALGCRQVLGDLNRNSVMEIWKGLALKNFRLKLRQDGLVADCNRCCQKDYY